MRNAGSPFRLALLLGMVGRENQIGANIPSKDRSAFSCEKYKFLLECPANISAKCCSVMKKAPAHRYARETGRFPITAQMASESRLRTQQWLKNGCNGFDMKSPISNPMSFWTEQDVLLYIREKGIPICSVYGEIVTDDEESGQLTIADVLDTGIFDFGRPTLHTTGCDRTGCMFCGYGCHLEDSPGRFERMKETHPNQYDYIMRGGAYEYTIKDKNGAEIKLRNCTAEQIEKWVSNNVDNENFSITAIWKPDNRGLGYKFLIDWLNENGDLNIRY